MSEVKAEDQSFIRRNTKSNKDVSSKDSSGAWFIPCLSEELQGKHQLVSDLVKAGLIQKAKISEGAKGKSFLLVDVDNSDDFQAVAKVHNVLLANCVLEEGQTIIYKTHQDISDGNDTIRYTSKDILLFNINCALALIDEYTSLLNRIWAAVKAFFNFNLSYEKQKIALNFKKNIEKCNSYGEVLHSLSECRQSICKAMQTERANSYSLFQPTYDYFSNKGELGQILDTVEKAIPTFKK